MSAHEFTASLPPPLVTGSCCPVSSCWDAVIEKSSVRAVPIAAATAAQYNRSPLGLSLYADDTAVAGRPPSPQPSPSSYLLDGLLREINLRKAEFTGRVTPWIKWRIPHHLLDNTDTTQLMYFIGRQFQLNDSHNNFYCVSFALHEVDTERLALFKGLGFNALEIIIPAEDDFDADDLTYCAALARDFHFQHFTVECRSTAARIDEKLWQVLRPSRQPSGVRTPDSISFKPRDSESAAASSLLQKLYWRLSNSGYSVLGNDVFVKAGSPLALAQTHSQLSRNLQDYNCQQVTDVLGLGPRNTSIIGAFRSTNPKTLSQYLSHSFYRRRVEVVDVRVKEMINQLLCYHQLNLLYCHEQLGVDLEYLFSQLQDIPQFPPAAPPQSISPGAGANHLLSTAQPLYQLQNNTLKLTPNGILQLSSICQALNRLFPLVK
jgi:hypothetical protein